MEVGCAKVMVMVEEVSPIGKDWLLGPWLPWSGLDRRETALSASLPSLREVTGAKEAYGLEG